MRIVLDDNKIIEDYQNGITVTQIASKYKVTRERISKILNKNNIETRNKVKKINEQEFIEKYKNGSSIHVLKLQYNVTLVRLLNILHNNNIYIKNEINNISTNNINDIIKLYNTNHSIREISSIVKISSKKITEVLLFNNISIRKSNETSKKYTFNENFFENIDTEEKAYWLGFIYSDGCIATVNSSRAQQFSIHLSEIDIGHIEKFKKCIGSTHPIYKSKSKASNGTICNTITFAIRSNKLCSDLKKHGVIEQKTNKIKYPKELNKALQIHFIRGLLDGDGCLKCTSAPATIEFLGTEDLLTNIQKYFNSNKKLFKYNGVYGLCYHGNQQCAKILHKLYDNASIYLDRKYKLYKKYFIDAEIKGIEYCENFKILNNKNTQ